MACVQMRDITKRADFVIKQKIPGKYNCLFHIDIPQFDLVSTFKRAAEINDDLPFLFKFIDMRKNVSFIHGL